MSLVRFASRKVLSGFGLRIRASHAWFGPAAGWSFLYSGESFSKILTDYELTSSSRAGIVLQLLKIVAQGPEGMAFFAAVQVLDRVDGLTDPTWRLRFGLAAMRESLLFPMYDKGFLPVPRYVDPALAGESSLDLVRLLAADEVMSS